MAMQRLANISNDVTEGQWSVMAYEERLNEGVGSRTADRDRRAERIEVCYKLCDLYCLVFYSFRYFEPVEFLRT